MQEPSSLLLSLALVADNPGASLTSTKAATRAMPSRLRARLSHLIIVACTAFTPCMGQAPGVHLLRSDDALDNMRAKLAVEVLRGLDQHAIASFDGDHMKVRINPAIHPTALIDALNEQGLSFLLIPPTALRSEGWPQAPSDPNDADAQQRYQQEKTRWIEEHPEEYRMLLQGQGASISKTP